MTCVGALRYMYGVILEDLHYQKHSQFLKPIFKVLGLLMLTLCALPTIFAYFATEKAEELMR